MNRLAVRFRHRQCIVHDRLANTIDRPFTGTIASYDLVAGRIEATMCLLGVAKLPHLFMFHIAKHLLVRRHEIRSHGRGAFAQHFGAVRLATAHSQLVAERGRIATLLGF